jgi:intracellular sulfur oxidation DsrE/DsrF family protein
MNNSKHDDFRIHAFVDDQLDSSDREEMMREMEQDAGLREEVCKLRHLKSVFRHAYVDEDTEVVPQPWHKRVGGMRPLLTRGLAAGFILMLGMGAGWLMSPSDSLMDRAVSLENLQGQPYKVILHIGESDPEKFSEVLATADNLVSKYKKAGVQVEVIANGGGLDLLRADTSPQAQRVSQMMESHANLRFIACANAIKHMEERGVHVSLINHTEKAPSALEHIVKRLQEGWHYIKV